MRVGIVANIEDPEAGYVEERLEASGATFLRRWRTDPESLDGFEGEVDLLVVLGSDWSVYDPDHAREIGAERALVLRATEYGCPTLGICFGGQLISSCLGGSVARAARGEIGWSSVSSDRPDLFESGPWFQYHLDAWAEVPGHRSIARSPVAPQAIVHRRTLGLQFHPEVTEDVIDRWIRHGASDLATVGVDPDAIAADTDRLIDGARDRCHALVDAFLASVASATV